MVTAQLEMAASDYTSIITLSQHSPRASDLAMRGAVYARLGHVQQAAIDYDSALQVWERQRSGGSGDVDDATPRAWKTALAELRQKC